MHETKSKMNSYKKGGMGWHGMGWDGIREYPPLKSHWYWCLSRVFRYPIVAFPTTNVVGHLGYTFGDHGGCKWVDSGAHFSFLINNTFIFLRYVFSYSCKPLSNLYKHQQLPWLPLAIALLLWLWHFLPPSLPACPCVHHWYPGTPPWVGLRFSLGVAFWAGLLLT